MKRFFLLLICATTLAVADEYDFEDYWHQTQPYDADLFRRDVQVFSGHVNFLYWRVQEGALDYALKMQHASPPGIVYAQGKYHRATFDGEPGFRLALGFFRAPNYWELWSQYTRYTGRGEDVVYAPHHADRYLLGTWPQVTVGPLSKATSRIHLNYNVGDFLVDRFINPNPHLRARFIGGTTVAWLNQDWVIRYFNEDTVTTQIQNRWKYVGGGLRFGSTFDWYTGGWDLYLTGGTTLAYFLGSYHNTAKQTTLISEFYMRDAHYFDVRSAFQIQATFGLSWQKRFCSSRVEVYTGYELNAWFNLAEVHRSTPGGIFEAKETLINSALLALQGLTARVSVDF